MNIINLTQHNVTTEQRDAGVVDLSCAVSGGGEPELGVAAARWLTGLLTFDGLPTQLMVEKRARAIAALVGGDSRITWGLRATHAMIGGAPYLMGPLEKALRAVGVTPIYAFSLRESVEETLPDGSVRKVAVFRHAGFIQA